MNLPAWLKWSAAGAAAYFGVLRPLHLRWGTTGAERRRKWPGDELLPHPQVLAMHGITIAAEPAAVWRWITQIGQDRGGFYSYTALENLFGARMRNTERLIPAWAERRPGESVWMAPPDRFGGNARMIVARAEPGRALVLVSPGDWPRVRNGETARECVWSFLLEPADGGGTRLLMRQRNGARPWIGGEFLTGRLQNLLFWEWAHFIMELGMMRSLKRLAEGGSAEG
jgi:hypothetical protein